MGLIQGTTGRSPATRILMLLVEAYRRVVSPWLPPSCRYVPTCSQYFLDALDGHGAIRGSWIGIKRIARCHPLGGHGLDPVTPPDVHQPDEQVRSHG